jgi:minichromosome maintenance protein 10
MGGNTAGGAAAAAAGAGANKRVPLGWGSTLKDKLGRMKDGERLDGRKIGNPPVLSSSDGGGGAARRGDKSPVRKKTRFVTEKGIREAGRESLGEPLSAAVKTRRQVVLDDDDDDDLIIVK